MTMLTCSKQGLGSVVAAALLAACSGTALPTSAPLLAAEPLNARNLNGQGSWIVPGAAKGNLLYVDSLSTRGVYMFSYPRLQLVGVLDHYYRWDQPIAICADEKGDVFLPMYAEHETLEFAHGGTRPIASLPIPNSYPYSCAIDPTTGNLAVSGALDNGAYTGVAIYASAKGKPTIYHDPYVFTPFCGYDNEGNLFVDGAGSVAFFELSELPKGAKTFSRVTVNQTISSAGNVQWDGKYVTVLDSAAGVIYRLKISKYVGTVVGSVTLGDAGGSFGSWIQDHHVVIPDEAHAEVQIYRYPAGGQVIKSTVLQQAFSATISPAPSQ